MPLMSFAAGLLIGQLSVLIVVALLLRFFLFAENSGVRLTSLNSNEKTIVRPNLPVSLETVLEHTYYDVDTHKSESMDWFTLLLALNINIFRQNAVDKDHLLNYLSTILTSGIVPPFVDTIKVTEINLGNDYPLLNNCKVVRSSNHDFSDGLEVQFDLDLKDKITLGIETRLLLNYPKAMVANLPIKVSLSLVNLSGRVSISMLTKPEHAVTVQFAPDFVMEFEVHSLVGARSQLKDVPKLSQVIQSTLRKAFAEKCVAPHFININIPTPWSRADSDVNEESEKKKSEKCSTKITKSTNENSNKNTKSARRTNSEDVAYANINNANGVTNAASEAAVAVGIKEATETSNSNNPSYFKSKKTANVSRVSTISGQLATESIILDDACNTLGDLENVGNSK